jgi:uncharacterized membrane protein
MTRAVDAYLKSLDEELRDLPAAGRREILQEIRDHIDSALTPESGEAEVRNVLERLGDPSEIAAEARDRFGLRPARAPGAREVLTLVLLLVGGFLWVVGWVVGAVLLATSTVWTSREKVIGLLVLPGGLLPAFLLGVLPGGQVCSETTIGDQVIRECSGATLPVWFAWAILIVLVIAPIWAVFFLASRMNRRTSAA